MTMAIAGRLHCCPRRASGPVHRAPVKPSHLDCRSEFAYKNLHLRCPLRYQSWQSLSSTTNTRFKDYQTASAAIISGGSFCHRSSCRVAAPVRTGTWTVYGVLFNDTHLRRYSAAIVPRKHRKAHKSLSH